MRRLCLRVLFFVVLSGAALAAGLTFPALSGRVVDDGNMLSETTRQQLDQTLATYEQQSGNQFVVATLATLQGASIEDYGYQLGRTWGIGQKDKNNGVILIVAPTERKVRIEVGYGLEGTLTDALASDIIHSIILPDFRAGKMQAGVMDGVTAILKVLGAKTVPSAAASQLPEFVNQIGDRVSTQYQTRPNTPGDNVAAFLVLIIFLIVFIRAFRSPFGLGGFGLPIGLAPGGSGGFSGGFSGGGGSFGGGGASGGW